jgi:hypothetical protein
VACGYSQVHGIDFTEISASVINDVSFRIILIAMIARNQKAKIIEIESAFLNSDLEGESYKDRQLVCNWMIDYRLVQSARQFYVLFKALKSYWFTGSLVDPCLWDKHYNSGVVMMEIYIYNWLTIGSDESIKEVIDDLKKKILVLRLKKTSKTTWAST